MATRAFPQGVERLVRRATIVNSAEDIRRVTTQCLADGTPCTLELGDNIVCSAGFTVPVGLKAFSVDGAQRFKFIVSGDLPFLFYAKGAENNDGCPVEVSNVEILVKEGSTLTTAFVLEQFSDVTAVDKRRPGLVLSNVFLQALDAGGIGSVLLQSDFLASTFRAAIVDVTNIQCRNVTHFLGDTDFLSLYVGSTFTGVSSTTTMSFGRGASSSPLVTCNISTMSGEIQVSIGDNSSASFISCNVDSYTGNAGTNTLLRVIASPRTVGPNEVDLDNISVPASPSLGLADWWYEARFGSNNAAAMDFFVGAAVSSGTNTTAIPAASVDGIIPAGVFLRSSTTANGGYRYQTSSLVGDRFGVTSHKYWAQFRWLTSFTGRTVFLGFHDSSTNADPVDGAYFKVTADVVSAVTANNSTRTTNATTVTLSLDVIYTFDVEVNAAGTEARFRVYAGTSSTPILDVTNTTNIPTTSARAFGTGVVATESSTTASDIGILYMQGAGTVAGFERARGQP